MRDVYTYPTIAQLADRLEGAAGETVAAEHEPFHTPSTLSYVTCGAMQAAFYAAYALFGLWVLDTGWEWATAASSHVRLP